MEIPERELTWTFSPSGGPGGQHANRSSTRAEVRWDVAGSSIDDQTKRKLLENMSGLREGVAVVVADNTRSQWRNRAEAKRRLQDRVEEALRPRKKRRPTRTPYRAKAKRREAKKRRSELKKTRRRPTLD